jgi:y4mF family transcriptional regulator
MLTLKAKSIFALYLKAKRRELELTQMDLARRAGVGLRFIRDVEQGKRTIRLDKLNQVLALFGCQAGPVPLGREDFHGEER